MEQLQCPCCSSTYQTEIKIKERSDGLDEENEENNIITLDDHSEIDPFAFMLVRNF